MNRFVFQTRTFVFNSRLNANPIRHLSQVIMMEKMQDESGSKRKRQQIENADAVGASKSAKGVARKAVADDPYADHVLLVYQTYHPVTHIAEPLNVVAHLAPVQSVIALLPDVRPLLRDGKNTEWRINIPRLVHFMVLMSHPDNLALDWPEPGSRVHGTFKWGLADLENELGGGLATDKDQGPPSAPFRTPSMLHGCICVAAIPKVPLQLARCSASSESKRDIDLKEIKGVDKVVVRSDVRVGEPGQRGGLSNLSVTTPFDSFGALHLPKSSLQSRLDTVRAFVKEYPHAGVVVMPPKESAHRIWFGRLICVGYDEERERAVLEEQRAISPVIDPARNLFAVKL